MTEPGPSFTYAAGLVLLALIAALMASATLLSPGIPSSQPVPASTPFVTSRSVLEPIDVFPGVVLQKALHPLRDREKGHNLSLSGDVAWVRIKEGSRTTPHVLYRTSEAIYISQGEASVHANGSMVNALQGEAVLIPPGSVQSVRNTGRGPLTYVSILDPWYDESREHILDAYDLTAQSSDTVPLLHWTPPMSRRCLFFNHLSLTQIFHPLAGDLEGIRAPVPYSWSHVAIPEGGGSLPHQLDGAAEVITVLNGSGSADCGGRTFAIREGDCLYIPPGTVQSVTNTGQGVLEYLTLIDPYWRPEIDIQASPAAGSPRTR